MSTLSHCNAPPRKLSSHLVDGWLAADLTGVEQRRADSTQPRRHRSADLAACFRGADNQV